MSNYVIIIIVYNNNNNNNNNNKCNSLDTERRASAQCKRETARQRDDPE
jgi:hypothetical protein